ncbi:hypothetical protein [Maridesulfovibrio ferrireducens]|uniref:hypothetical protein n=1 Tax=Maridesulfovibrio ferrireducens TaxID=246191 RepID=UPI001A2FD73D|nr:hypothetical protein [Maridesulfovibrio ferrireducens]MBI9113357.1 hypothetical protein [Maridesulfovibrio ferrireducens]
MTTDELRTYLLNTLPPVICRKGVEDLTGGLIKATTLAFEDHQGTGPTEGRFKQKRKVFYAREPFVNWFIEKTESIDV